MKDFDYYIKEGSVKRQSVDVELAKSLKDDAMLRAEKVVKLPVKEFSKIIFENVYDALRELLDAVLALEGYKSYSHEASIAYLKKFGVEDSLLAELDSFRYKRNSSKYYGKSLSGEDAEAIMYFYDKQSVKIIKIIEQLCIKLNNRAKK